MNETKLNSGIAVGIVGFVPIDQLPFFKQQIEELHNFEMIYFKVSGNKLWIKEGDPDE